MTDTAEVWNLVLWAAPLYHLPTKLHHQLPSSQLRSTWWAGNSTCKISLRGNTSWKLCKQVGLAWLCAGVIYNKKSRVHFLWNFITALSLDVANGFSSVIVLSTTIETNGACRVCYPELQGGNSPLLGLGEAVENGSYYIKTGTCKSSCKSVTLRQINIFASTGKKSAISEKVVKIFSAITQFVSMILCFQCHLHYILSVIRVNLNSCLTWL